MRIAFTTLGCKINQYESDEMRRQVESQGNIIVPFDAEADVYVINTCSVTAKSDYQCRQIIRSAVRRSPKAKVMVTGCYAETRPDEIKKIEGVHSVIGNIDKLSIPSRILEEFSQAARTKVEESVQPGSTIVPVKTRGFLKIQDGCNNECTYCLVRIARGKSRSIDVAVVLDRFDQLVDANCPEVVLSGIHIGTYGLDLPLKTDLTELLRLLLARRGGTRIRLSSIEPNEITDTMIEFLGNGLCRHLHIPLQSGDDAILKLMNRNYTSGFYFDLVEKIHHLVPGIAIGADVIVGFPGEGDAEFNRTVELIEDSPLTHLHVFSFSPRPGTIASSMKGQVREDIKKQRGQILRELGKKKNRYFTKTLLGSVQKVAVEDKKDSPSGDLTGLTENYVRVVIRGGKNEDIGRIVQIKLDRVLESAAFGAYV